MQPRHKELSFGIKLKKLYANNFYLPEDVKEELCWDLLNTLKEKSSFGESHAIRIIDEKGEWLD